MKKMCLLLLLLLLHDKALSSRPNRPVEQAPQKIDQFLKVYFKTFLIESPKTIINENKVLYSFGKLLFEDKSLSMNKDVSCKSCHDIDLGLGDGLPFSIGTGGNFLIDRESRINKSFQANAKITTRSAPHLFNKGHQNIIRFFWDGRISYNPKNKTYLTPFKGFNGPNPPYKNIVNKIDNPLAMQALFPLINETEMRGDNYADMTSMEVWREITRRVKANKNYSKFISDSSSFSISEIANALAYFQKIEFQVNNTPLDDYIKGDYSALSLKEKKGAVLFVDKARCAKCHNGALLSNGFFQNIAVPHIGEGIKNRNDEGHFYVSKNQRHKYAFLNQPLRNIALTAPYFHNGAFKKLSQVIEHYNNPAKSLYNYNILDIESLYSNNYNERIYVDRNQYNNFYRIENLHGFLKTPLNLTKSEKSDLLCFLQKSLTQRTYHYALELERSCR